MRRIERAEPPVAVRRVAVDARSGDHGSVRLRSTTLVLAALLIVAACSGSDDAGSSAATTDVAVTTVPGPATDPTTTTTDSTEVAATPDTSSSSQAPASTEVVPVGDWIAIPGGDDCRCSDGSPFEVWERPADPTKVMLFFQGGGACFSAETCGPGSETFTRNLDLGAAPDFGGIFDATNPENPLADHSIVYVPYCTGDVHLGDSTTEYSDTVVIEHNGFANARKGLDTVLANYPDVEQLVVAGASAGSIPTPAFAGLAADELPGVDIVTFGDSSAAYPDVPDLNVAIGGLWGVLENVPDWPVNEGLTPQEWSFPGLYVQSGLQHPDITFARFDHAFDQVQAGFAALAGIAADDLVAFIDRTETDIEAEGVPIASYVAPGDSHTIVLQDGFYDMEVDGVRLVDFLATLVGGDVPPDVHCTVCN